MCESRHRIRHLVLALALAAGGALAPWIVAEWSRTAFLRVLDEAEAGGRWLEALEWCLEHRHTVGAQADLLGRCSDAAQGMAEAMGTVGGPQEAAAAVHALAGWGDREALAVGLDRSRVTVPAGEFVMGSNAGRDNERPEHRVYLDSFAIARFEVANAQYARFADATGASTPKYWAQGEYPAGQEAMPVVGVMWEQAQAYCVWTGGRLPTEAEWERACRGEIPRIYPWGDAWDATRANIALGRERAEGTYLSDLYPVLQSVPGEGAPGLRPVGSYPQGASSVGVLDLVGNAAEWVADWYNWEGYGSMPAVNPVGEGPEWNRSVRGSSWFFRMGMDHDVPLWSRCSARNSSHASIDPRVGFRCAYPSD